MQLDPLSIPKMVQETGQIEGESAISLYSLKYVPCGDEALNSKENPRYNIETCEAEGVKIITQEEAQATDTYHVDVETKSNEALKLRR